jgi:hypothetical protein
MPNFDLDTVKHPDYSELEEDWLKWRRTYQAGDDFITEYLEKFSTREDDADFTARQNISYDPAFAAAAVTEVKDAIFQRISDVTREGGSQSYNNAVKGLDKGIDLAGTTMNSFMGRIILEELLPMKKVGVFIDMPQLNGQTLSDQQGQAPYIYHYKAEDIVNWDKDPHHDTFTKLLLRDWVHTYHEGIGLPNGFIENYRFLTLNEDGFINVTFYDSDFQEIGMDSINLPEIPFVTFELPHSLLKNISNYQIALLNLESSDIAYILKSNYPFYVEWYDPRVDNLYARSRGDRINRDATTDTVSIVESGERTDAQTAKPYEIEVGTTTGRRVPLGLESPQFIAPPTDPLLASMQKQEQIKKDIRMLVKLNVSNLSPKMASGESKSFDERSLEAGLSAIGLELEHGERRIAKYWQWYEDSSQNQATIKYPEKYSLQSDADTRKEAKDMQESTKGHPSITYKREVYKVTANMLVGSSVSKETMDQIRGEIDRAAVIVSDPEELHRDIEVALIDPETASKAKGYPSGVVKKAEKAHAERLKRIAESQGKARGADDLSGIAPASRSEKIDKDQELTSKEKTRG